MRISVRSVLAAALASVLLAGCAGTPSGEVDVVKVGRRTIAKQDLEGWMAAIAPEHAVPDPPQFGACVAGKDSQAGNSLRDRLRSECARQYADLKARALSFLIRCEWFVAEAARRGLAAPVRLVRAGVASQGRGLRMSGATARDVELKVEAESAISMLRREFPEPSAVTPSQALSYYRRHLQRFSRPERRYFEIAENLTRDEAAKLLERSGHGAKASAPPFFVEEFPRSSIAAAEGEYRVLRAAIFAAKPHVMSGPVMLNGRYTVFEVTRVRPARPWPFHHVSSLIEKLLERDRRVQLPGAFLAALRGRWAARTECQRGYVVQQCRRYSGVVAPEGALE